MSLVNFSVKLSHFNINISVKKDAIHNKNIEEKLLLEEKAYANAVNHREIAEAQFHSMSYFN